MSEDFIYTIKTNMAKYRKSLALVICQLIGQNLSVTNICRLSGITRNTFYQWYKKKPAFRQAIDGAYKDRDAAISSTLSNDKITIYEKRVHY